MLIALWRVYFSTQLSKHQMSLFTHGTGLIAERNCTWCAPGKYQTGLGLIDEVNCTWCVAGKYQTGSGWSSSNCGSDVFAAKAFMSLIPGTFSITWIMFCIILSSKQSLWSWSKWLDRNRLVGITGRQRRIECIHHCIGWYEWTWKAVYGQHVYGMFVSKIVTVCSSLSFNGACIKQVWLLSATARGVCLASIRLGWVLLSRSTAQSALLGSTRLDQVVLTASLFLSVGLLIWKWNLIFPCYHGELQSSAFRLPSWKDGNGIWQVWSRRITAHCVLLERTKLDRVHIGYFPIFLIERAALEFLTVIRPFMTCLFQCSASKLYTLSLLRIGQDWLQGATAHGVRLASIRLGWVWLARSTAQSALLGSTRLDQVSQICLIYCSQRIWLNRWSLLWSYHV